MMLSKLRIAQCNHLHFGDVTRILIGAQRILAGSPARLLFALPFVIVIVIGRIVLAHRLVRVSSR